MRRLFGMTGIGFALSFFLHLRVVRIGANSVARDYLPGIAAHHLISADLIAGGISPLCPELAP
jgi:hypothetical protein